ncbi:hypothetical protein VPH35_106528 [Triticum aestivum]
MLLLAAAAPCRGCRSLPLLLAAAPCDGCSAPAATVPRSRQQQQHDEVLAGVAHIAVVDQLRIGADLGKRRNGGSGRLRLGVAVTGMAVVARCRLGGGDAGESGMAMVARDREFREER